MIDGPGVSANELTLKELANQFSVFREDSEARINALTGEIARLTGRPAGTQVHSAFSPNEPQPTIDSDVAEESDRIGRLSRRGALLALGGAAAGGVGVALGSTLLGAQPAGASNGAPVLLGEPGVTNAATAETGILAAVAQGVTLAAFNSDPNAEGALYGEYGSGSDFFLPGAVIGDTDGSNDSVGILGTAQAGIGVHGLSVAQSSIHGLPALAAGVVGNNQQGIGVGGLSGGSNQSTGQGSDSGPACWGVYGVTVGVSGLPPLVTTGVFGETNSGDGVRGSSSGGNGIVGVTNHDGSSGVSATDQSPTGGTGVYGTSVNGNGVVGEATSPDGVGVMAQNNDGAQLRLLPSTATTLPAASSPGQFTVLSDGSLHYCQSSGQWVTLVPAGPTFVPISPMRAYDSRVSQGGPGPLNPGGSRNVSLTSAGVPAGAAAVLINMTVVNTVKAGYLTVFEAGAPVPKVSNMNWFESGQITANNATSSLSATDELTVLCGGTGGTDFLIDVFGYYT